MAIYQGETRVANNYQIDNSVYCVPIGSIIPYASTTLPKGFLLCDGAEISKTDYADLYEIIGDTFGTATDSTKFKLPDLRDKFVQGANGNLGTNKEAGLPNITGHFALVGNDNAAFYGDAGGAFTTQDSNYSSFVNGSGQVGLKSNMNWTFNASKSNSIYGNSTTVQPPAVCLCYIIKATKLSDIPVDVSGVIDDNTTGADSTWSSNKISNQLQSVDATTLDGKSADVFLQNQGILNSGDLLEHILTMTDSGYFFASSGVTSTPVEGQWFWVDVKRDERGDYCITATRYNQGGVYTNRYNNNADMKKWYGWSNVASTVINDSTTTSKNETWSANKINSTLSMLPFKWTLIGTSEPETSGTSNKTFKKTMRGGSPFCVYHSSGVFCFGNGVPANRGKLYGMTAGQVASVDYSTAGELTVTVGSGKAYIYEMETITD